MRDLSFTRSQSNINNPFSARSFHSALPDLTVLLCESGNGSCALTFQHAEYFLFFRSLLHLKLLGCSSRRFPLE